MKRTSRFISVLIAIMMAVSSFTSLVGCQNEPDKGNVSALVFVTTGLKTTYNLGEEVDYSSIKINAVYESGDSETLTLKSEGVTYNELDMTKAGEQTLTATYKQKSASIKIKIIDQAEDLVSLSIRPNIKTAYVVGEEFDYSKVVVLATYSTDKTVELSLENGGVEYNQISLATAGAKTLTVTFGELSASITINVYETAPAKELSALYIESGFATRYTIGATINTDAIKLIAVYNDGASKIVQVSEGQATMSGLDASKLGTQTVVFSYEEEGFGEVSYSINVVVSEPEDIIITVFDLPESYQKYMDNYSEDPTVTHDDDHRDVFMKGAGEYQVGADNGFVFIPDVRAIDNASLSAISLSSAKTSFTLEIEQDGEFVGANVEQYLMTNSEVATAIGENDYTIPANYYFFKSSAIGNVFKISITLDSEYRTQGLETKDLTISAIVKVVDGYNVYDQTGLSVIDNLNVKHWKEIKTSAGRLAWDLKPLVEYNSLADNTVVSQVILHNNITIDPDLLPENYFWDKDRNITEEYNGTPIGNQGYNTVYSMLSADEGAKSLGYDEKLNGSLRDYSPIKRTQSFSFNTPSNGPWTEDYCADNVNDLKGIYNVAGTGISGNCMTISYITEGAKHKLYAVYDGETVNLNPLGHWILFKYVDEGIISGAYPNATFSTTPVANNIRIIGNMPRKSQTNGEPPQLTAFSTCTDLLTLDNVIISQFYIATSGDWYGETRSLFNIYNSKVYDIYSNIFYFWRSNIEVRNSILKEAGGPVFILIDGNRRGGTDFPTSQTDNNYGPNLTVDEDSVLESYSAGYEPWYQLNNATALFGAIKGDLRSALLGGFGLDYIHTDEVETINVIAAVLPEPSHLMESYDQSTMIQVNGAITRVGETSSEVYRMGHEMTVKENILALMKLQAPEATDEQLLQAYNNNTSYLTLQATIAQISATNAPIFLNGNNMGAYLGEQGFMSLSSTNPSPITDIAQIRTAWANPSDWLFITMRAAATTPRFGVLLGNVVKAN